jgi:hypothetical protein
MGTPSPPEARGKAGLSGGLRVKMLATIRRRGILLAALYCAVAATICCEAPAALGARIHPLLVAETLPVPPGNVNPWPIGVAVDQSTHHFYVTTIGGATDPTYNFDENGEIDATIPELTGGQVRLQRRVAIDNSGGPHDGYAYVTTESETEVERLGGWVQQFDPSGAATVEKITNAAVPANGTPQGGGLLPVVNKGVFRPVAIAVDDEGNVFVQEEEAEAIDEFSPSGAFIAQIAAGKAGSGTVQGLAADADGHLYLADAGVHGLGSGLFELAVATGECVQVGCVPIVAEPTYAVAVDNAEGTVFVTGQQGVDQEGWIKEYEVGTGKLLGVTQPVALHRPEGGIAVDEGNGQVIVGDIRPLGEATVKIFGAVEVVPDVELKAPEDVTANSAHLKGEIGAAEVPGATCSFEYVDAEEFAEHRFEEAAEVPCEPNGPFSGTATNSVEAALNGLLGGTTYYLRLVGHNANGSNATDAKTFTTLGPSVTDTEAIEVTQVEATMTGIVNPNGSPTSYLFEYLTEAEYESTGWANAIKAPEEPGQAGSGSSGVRVSQRIEGLASGTRYRFRVAADSAEGMTQSEGVSFVTFGPSSSLPDNRRYEQVSPVNKGGANAQGEVNAVAASPEGDRVTFFSQAGIPGGEGEQQFPSYLSTRSPAGWSTQGILPPASAGRWAGVVGWTEGLGQVYDFAGSTTAGTRLLSRDSEGGDLTQVGEAGATASESPFYFAGSSADGSVALLETNNGGLAPGDLPGEQNVYVYDGGSGALSVAGVLNDGSVPSGGAMAGPYDWYTSGDPSQDGGASDFYYTQAEHAISADGKRVFFTAGGTGQLYVRMNPSAEPAELGAQECLERDKACTVRISAPEAGVADPGTPAAFVGASADGSVAYLLDKGRLTQGSTAGPGSDLYRYDLKSGQLTDLTVDSIDKGGAQVTGVLGVSEMGGDVYFVASGGLAGATQAPAGETNLYELHGDAIHFIARLANSVEEERNWIPRSKLRNLFTAANSARISRDGQTLLFRSQRQLTSYRNRGEAELYLYRAGDGLLCVSCNPTGEAPSGPAGVQEISGSSFALALPSAILTRNLSADGKRVVFDSGDRLVAADRNDGNDVYEWEANGEGSCSGEAQNGGCLYLISGAAGGESSYLADIDENGNNIFFFTGQSLVAQDKDQLVDLYDASVEGGIPSQEVVPPGPCEGETGCLGAVSGSPGTTSSGTSSFNGPGNPKPAPCKKGTVRKNGKCVKKPNTHKHKHHHKKKSKNKKGSTKGKKGEAQHKGAKKGGHR